MDVQTTTTTRLAPLLELVRAAAAATDRTAFLPFVAREVLGLVEAAACEVWVDADGPALAAVHRRAGASPASPGSAAIAAVLEERELAHVDGWLCVPLPVTGEPGGTTRAAVALTREGAFSSDEVALVEVAAAVARLGLDAADAGRMDAASRDEFLALLGHDLRSPLSNVRVGSQLAQRNLEAGDLESVREALRIIENQSGRLLGRLEALLDAVAASGGWLIRLEPLDLAALVRETIQPFELAAAEKGCGTRFKLESPADLPSARGDLSQIRRVLEHLIDNGAKYAEGGTVKATLSSVEDGVGVRLDVCDDGPGIRPEDVDRVFAPFGRGRNVGGRAGHGLGLYLARNIARAHGGRLWIARTSRSGTCMALTLPGAVDVDAGKAEA